MVLVCRVVASDRSSTSKTCGPTIWATLKRMNSDAVCETLKTLGVEDLHEARAERLRSGVEFHDVLAYLAALAGLLAGPNGNAGSP